MSDEEFPAASQAVTVIEFKPEASAIGAVQFAVPVAVPFPPAALLHVTDTTPTLSVAVPPIVTGVDDVA